MPSKSGMYGIGSGIGTLIGAFLRGREEQEYERKLKEMLEQQRRDVEAAQMQSGVMQGPPRPMQQPQPPPDRSFGDFLMGIPGQIGAGLTRGSPAITGLEQQYQAGGDELTRARNLADTLQAAKLQRQLPLGVAREQEIGLLGGNAAEQARIRAVADKSKEEYRQGEMNKRATERNAVLSARPGAQPGFTERLYQGMTDEEKAAYRVNLTGSNKPAPGEKADPLIKYMGELEEKKKTFTYNVLRSDNKKMSPEEADISFEGLKAEIQAWNMRHPNLPVALPEFDPAVLGGWFGYGAKPATVRPGAIPSTPASSLQAPPLTPAAPRTPPIGGTAYRIEEGPAKGMIIDSKETYEELKRKGIITGKERVSVEAQ